jgi:hypothetical protein
MSMKTENTGKLPIHVTVDHDVRKWVYEEAKRQRLKPAQFVNQILKERSESCAVSCGLFVAEFPKALQPLRVVLRAQLHVARLDGCFQQSATVTVHVSIRFGIRQPAGDGVLLGRAIIAHSQAAVHIWPMGL